MDLCLSFGKGFEAKSCYFVLQEDSIWNTEAYSYVNRMYGIKLYKFSLIISGMQYINPLKTKRRLLYLKAQFVPRSKHFSSRL